MNAKFTDLTNKITDEIIDLSRQLDNEQETWRDVMARVPDSSSNGVSAGYVSKPTTASNIELVTDIQAPPTEQTARLRIWAIETTSDSDRNERFNNIQVTYHLDYGKAHAIIEQTKLVTRDTLSLLAHDPSNYIESIVISDLTGMVAATGELLGKRYELDLDDLRNMTEEICNEVVAVMNVVLARLKLSAGNT
ncbi:hypothetical protein H7171_01915 [Candidatus Saccharibacteria bacterium]|nr:hypothetical protein [Candidatus Saccharibacteria bacterium]